MPRQGTAREEGGPGGRVHGKRVPGVTVFGSLLVEAVDEE